jgi:hypothetical protein
MGNEKDLRDSKKQGEGTNAIRKGRKAKKRRGPHSKRGGEYNRPGTGAKVGRTKGRKQRIRLKTQCYSFPSHRQSLVLAPWVEHPDCCTKIRQVLRWDWVDQRSQVHHHPLEPSRSSP